LASKLSRILIGREELGRGDEAVTQMIGANKFVEIPSAAMSVTQLRFRTALFEK